MGLHISNKSHTLYIGMTADLAQRYRQHRSGTCERELKRWRRAKKIALIQSVNPDWTCRRGSIG